MIICASSNPGDIVLDCFAGSGTTLGAAFDCGRVWIGADNSPESIKAILKRFTGGLEFYGDYVRPSSKYVQMSLDMKAGFSFSIFTTPALICRLQDLCSLHQIDGNAPQRPGE